MMKRYDQLMEHLSFRESFCEDTLRKATERKKPKPILRRPAMAAACICMCMVLLLGTALAVSPVLRGILIPNFHVETTEEPQLPQEPNTQLENAMGQMTAQYYKLDGALDAAEGFGSVLPVRKNGVLSFYTLTESGELKKAKSPRHIQTDITYKGHTWTLDKKLYDGEIPTISDGVFTYPIEDHYLTLGRQEGRMWLPIWVDLTTLAIEDPAENLSFTPPEDALRTYVHGQKGSSTLLIRSELSDDLERCYYGNRDNGQVILLGEGSWGTWVFHGGKIYSYDGNRLFQIREDGTQLPLLGGKPCSYDPSGFAYRRENADLHIFDLNNEKEYLLANSAHSFPNPVFTHNRAGAKLCIFNGESQGTSIYASVIAIVDQEKGTMVTLNRNPGMKEQILGWFDYDHFLIGGTIEEEWYVSLYKIP